MKTFCIIALVLAVSFAVQMRPMTNSQINKYESLKKGNNWAGIMMNLAELHIQAQGPLDELIDAIEGVIGDIERKTDRSHEEYDTRSTEHASEVSRINGQVNSAKSDIASTTELLNNVLYVQKANLEEDIANLQQGIADTQQHVLEATQIREEQHVNYNTVVSEHNEALDAVHEALEILSQLFEGASLIQVKKAQKSIERVQQKIGNNIEGSMVKALLSLTSEQFSNQADVQKVNELLNEIASNLIASIAKFSSEEEQQQADYVQDIALSKNNISRMSIEITEKSEALNQTNASIEDNEDFLEQRKRDQIQYEQDLVDENANFDRITEIYEDLVAQLASEESACYEALDVLQNGDIAGYIGGRMEQDVVIDSNHGTGLSVERDSFDLQ